MYREYIKELSLYSERIRKEPITDEEFYEIYSNEFLLKIFIQNDSDEVVGFCLVGFGKNTHPRTNYYISEFYILPEFRCSGFGRSAFKKLLALFPGRYCYHVLKENKDALAFWSQMKKECGCKELILEDTLELSDCFFFAFSNQI